jgi:hypothetical protein
MLHMIRALHPAAVVRIGGERAGPRRAQRLGDDREQQPGEHHHGDRPQHGLPEHDGEPLAGLAQQVRAALAPQRRLAVAHPPADHQRRHAERGGVEGDRQARVVCRQGAAQEVPGNERGLAERLQHRQADHVPVAFEEVRVEGRPGGLERRVEQRGQQQEREQDRQRDAGHRDEADGDHPGDVGHDHGPPVRVALGQRGQDGAQAQPGQIADREGGAGGEDRVRALEDQRRHGRPGHRVAERRQGVGEEERPELAACQDLTKRGRALGEMVRVGHQRVLHGLDRNVDVVRCAGRRSRSRR